MLFKSLAVFATLAFGAISSLAAPVLDNDVIIANVLSDRCDACDAQKGVAGIIADVKLAVTPYVNEFHYIKKENCTAEAIEPLIVGIKVAVNDGLVKVNALAGASVDVILASAVDVNVKLDVHAVASIVADLIVFIFTGIKVILDLNVTACLSVVIPLFCALG
ncbi:hypothetical protein BC629DRAFT_1554509 [Irpex lacteus]|nr:hypothetical protein BC629DRAFT_1554509 [Irpex lacteus]